MEKIEEKQAPVPEGQAKSSFQEEQITQSSLPNSLIMRIIQMIAGFSAPPSVEQKEVV